MIQAETLELLEWQRLCHHLATFATTKLGAVVTRNLQIPQTPSETLELLAQTKEAYELELRLASGLSLQGIQDIGDALERVERQGILSGEELLNIASTLAGARQLRRQVDAHQEEVPVLAELVSELRTYPELEQEIHRCIDDRGDVTDRANPKLTEIRSQLKSTRDRIYQILQSILQRQAGAIQEQLITQRGDRFVIPVKAPQKAQVPGIVHDTSAKGGTLYIEPKSTIELNNQLRQLQRREQAEEEVVRRVLSEQVAEVQPDLERLLVIVTTIDLAVARARYSLWLEANPPTFTNLKVEDETVKFVLPSETENKQFQNPVTLRQLRHPLLVWQQQHEQGTAVVPIDVTIKPTIRVVAITGPNTGGKTVTLKTIGMAAIMAKVGLFIPAREPVELPWFDLVLADIGDEQSIEQSLSTFSGHIRRISRILEGIAPVEMQGLVSENQDEFEAVKIREEAENIDEFEPIKPNNPISNSLILLDEIGAGTDPTEGSALATSLLQYLADSALLTIATTHFGELKALKYQDERFENASVEFDEKTLQPTYRLLWGIPGRSNALTIAKRLGLKLEILETAANYLGGASQDVNDVIAGLEAQRKQQETKAEAASKLLKETERLHQELSRKAAALKERELELKQAQEKAIQDALVQAKGEIAQVIRRLQQGQPKAQDAQKATEALDQIAQQRLPSRQQKPPEKPKFQPKVGDRIRIPSIGQTAEVLNEPDENGQLTVRFGIMKMSVSLAEIESLDGQKPEIPTKSKSSDSHKSSTSEQAAALPQKAMVRTSKNTLDLRGKRVSEAEIEIDQMLGHMVDFGAIWIIHGKGTGQLRRGVQEFLTNNPLIDRFELATEAEGGAGVTVAYLK
ncbi:endonuclease MutS2 [Limnoraphis robusta]|uniref:Endonuclease MutS2 n=1 Tax=Limnoraphis robusta CCNP1315 TaxID=3110306 RepID=A0ABU5TUY7_9CYAN|nr:endonuclease MutS2 [Limnoraphis robusta]MEA5518716.1 endonuclease MutS2 [Limnoraphis robusta CCNP1315]MEA5544963.1 endonuclease MutS2 [Limnoraphis robusta CCNP1324]